LIKFKTGTNYRETADVNGDLES